MSGPFNEPGNCLIFSTLTDYSKAQIQTEEEGKVKCQLAEPMYDPREGMVYELGEEFTVIVDSPVKHEFCGYDHGWAMVRVYSGYGEGREDPRCYGSVRLTSAQRT